MADVAETAPAKDASETVVDDVEEDENKVRAQPSLQRAASTRKGAINYSLQEIQLMKQRVEEMEREASKLRELQAAAEKDENGDAASSDATVPMETEEDKALADSRSIYIGNASTFSEELFPAGV